MSSIQIRLAAMQDFLDLDRDMWDELATGMTCTEANVIAELYEAFGDEAGGAYLRKAHSYGDDAGDMHYDLRDDITDDERAEYLAAQEADDD